MVDTKLLINLLPFFSLDQQEPGGPCNGNRFSNPLSCAPVCGMDYLSRWKRKQVCVLDNVLDKKIVQKGKYIHLPLIKCFTIKPVQKTQLVNIDNVDEAKREKAVREKSQ